MRLLFSMRHLGSLRMYESVLRQLAARGHSIDILAKRRDVPGTAAAPETMLSDVPQIRWIWEDTHVTPWVDSGRRCASGSTTCAIAGHATPARPAGRACRRAGTRRVAAGVGLAVFRSPRGCEC
jgi:hypothetical protein